MSNFSRKSSKSSSISRNNYGTRLQNAFIVLAVILVSTYFGGCDLTIMRGCGSKNLLVYNCAFSVLLYHFFYSIFQASFDNISWKLTGSAALGISVISFFYVQDNAFVYIVEIQKYLALLWLFVQGLTIIDIAHEVHLYIIKRAELAYNFRGAQAAKPWYLVHMILSIMMILTITWASYLFLSQCGRCAENIIFISMILSTACLSAFFSLSEHCNKGLLIPIIVCCYSLLVCTNALLSNPNASCNSITMESVTELESYRNTAKGIINWLLLLTAVTSLIYAAITGSPSLIALYKCISFIPYLGEDASTSYLNSDLCCLPMSSTEYRLELGLEDNSHPQYIEKSTASMTTGLELCREQGDIYDEIVMQQQQFSAISNSQSVLQFDRSSLGKSIIGKSQSRVSGETTGESTSLLRDHHQMLLSDANFGPCSSKAKDDLRRSSPLLFSLQLGLATNYLAVLVSDWSYAAQTSDSTAVSSQYLELETMYIKLVGSAFVWLLYGVVLLNSYLIYRQHNRKLRNLIRI
jgi:hypothetical protein